MKMSESPSFDSLSSEVDLTTQRLITSYFKSDSEQCNGQSSGTSIKSSENSSRKRRMSDKEEEEDTGKNSHGSTAGPADVAASASTTTKKFRADKSKQQSGSKKSSSVSKFEDMTMKVHSTRSNTTLRSKLSTGDSDDKRSRGPVKFVKAAKPSPEHDTDSSDAEHNSLQNGMKPKTKKLNLEFYRNNIRSQPDGDYIEEILSNWAHDYKKLEQHHGYIQWLFPLKESGMNMSAHVLQDEEAEAIRADPQLKGRVLRSYKMMLAFYGITLVDAEQGSVGPSIQYRARIAHLNGSFHNNLRITRILKALGQFGFEHLKKPLVTFLVNEAFQKNTLVNARQSCVDFWIPTIADDEDRKALENLVKELKKEKKRDKYHWRK